MGAKRTICPIFSDQISPGRTSTKRVGVIRPNSVVYIFECPKPKEDLFGLLSGAD